MNRHVDTCTNELYGTLCIKMLNNTKYYPCFLNQLLYNFHICIYHHDITYQAYTQMQRAQTFRAHATHTTHTLNQI